MTYSNTEPPCSSDALHASESARESGSSALIALAGIDKIFFTESFETHALTDVHLRIERGDYVAIAGPSGCGKSTLLSIMGLLEDPTKGQYILDGNNVGGLSRAEKARVRNTYFGFVFQAFNLIGDLTVFENVELPLKYRTTDAEARSEMVLCALDRVGLVHRTNHFPAQLSGGQQQRVAFARAIVGEPALLFADEPTGNLDSANSEAVMELIKSLHATGTTVCLVTHDPRYADHASRTFTLLDGRIVDEKIGYGT